MIPHTKGETMNTPETENTISYKTMKLDEIGNSIYYRVACQCGSQDCDLVLELEYDKDFDCINIRMYKKLHASAHWGDYWDHFDFIRVLWNKIKMCSIVMTKGYVEITEETMIQGEEHIDSFISALQQGKRFIVGKEKEWQKFLELQKQEPKNLSNAEKDK